MALYILYSNQSITRFTPERKNQLRELNDSIYNLRDELVALVEVEHKGLSEAVKSSDASQRLEVI